MYRTFGRKSINDKHDWFLNSIEICICYYISLAIFQIKYERQHQISYYHKNVQNKVDLHSIIISDYIFLK